MGAMSILTFQPLPRLVSSFHTGLEPIRYELQGQLLMGWFISGHLTSIRPRPEPCRARSMGLWLVGRRPVLSEGGYSNSPDLNATFTFVCLRSPLTRPRSLHGYVLMNS